MRGEFRKTLKACSTVDMVLKDNNAAYIKWLESQVVSLKAEVEGLHEQDKKRV